MTYHFKIINQSLPPYFLKETLNRPWMRLFIFIDDGPLARTPEHYKKFIYDWKVVTPSPVHYVSEPGLWKKLEDGQVRPVQNVPIPLKYPLEMHQGIWGGEAVVKGYHIKNKKRPLKKIILPMKFPFEMHHGLMGGEARKKGFHIQELKKVAPVVNYWVPSIEETVLYSEVLNKYMRTLVTNRALQLIDQHYGLDYYLLKTPPRDLVSELAIKLKREILYTLLEKSMYPDDPVMREEIYNKYKEFIIPEEEVEWFGLTLAEAYRKQTKLEEEQQKLGPYKNIFRKEFIEQLKQASMKDIEISEEEKKKTLLQKLSSLNIFKSGK